MATFLSILKAIGDFLGILKFFEKIFKKTEIQKDNESDANVEAEKNKVKETGRPE